MTDKTYVVATRHADYMTFEYPPGSTVIDPWRYIPDREGVEVIRLGQNGRRAVVCPPTSRRRMLKVGMVGLGKLGLPVALAMESKGHQVFGNDQSPQVAEILTSGRIPYQEVQAESLLARSKIAMRPTKFLEEWADIVFVAVQTPHQPQYEGVTRLPDDRADFDYTYLEKAVRSVANARLIVIISTALPGAVERVLHACAVNPNRVLYNPFFIAMGTTIRDFLNPEFVLVGTDGADTMPLREFYTSIHDRPVVEMSIRSAELAKVAYNTYIGMKIAFANTVMELAHKTGADSDSIIDALAMADQRLMGDAYLRGGMGDGGGCHPRDNIALSWLARETGLSYDLFGALMECREQQAEWIADLAELTGNPIEIQGKAYKPNTRLTTGSPATLLANILDERDIEFEHTDPHVE